MLIRLQFAEIFMWCKADTGKERKKEDWMHFPQTQAEIDKHRTGGSFQVQS